MPAWYPYLKAAKYLGCRPWELFDQPACWVQWSLGADDVEQRAREKVTEVRQRSQDARQKWEADNR